MGILYSLESFFKILSIGVPFLLLICMFDEIRRENDCKKRYVVFYAALIIASIIII